MGVRTRIWIWLEVKTWMQEADLDVLLIVQRLMQRSPLQEQFSTESIS